MKNSALLFITSVISFNILSAGGNGFKPCAGPDSARTVEISVVGDLMCHSPEIDYSRAKNDSLDFRSIFSVIKNDLTVADLTIGNLETTLSGREMKFSGYPLFNSPDQFLDAIKDAGFNFLFTSNNHCMDRGQAGLLQTLVKIHALRIGSTGTFSSLKDRDSIRILNVKGIRIALLAYTYGINGNQIPAGAGYLVNPIDTCLIQNDIVAANAHGADIVIVYFHFGDEYKRTPSAFQNAIVDKTFRYGADIILGSHPHVVQTASFVQKSSGHLAKGFVAFSLGNFISNQRWRYSDCGVILNIWLTKRGEHPVTISGVSILPTWVYKGKIGSRNRFVILPSDSAHFPLPAYLSKSDKIKLLQSCSDTKKMFDAVTAKGN